MKFSLRKRIKRPSETIVLRRIVEPVNDGTEVWLPLYQGQDEQQIKAVIDTEHASGHVTLTLEVTSILVPL